MLETFFLTIATRRSEWLLKGVVREMEIKTCKRFYNFTLKGTLVPGLPDGITDNLICASNRKKPADTCEGLSKNKIFKTRRLNSFPGDSGSGLQLLVDGVFYIHGVTSFGLSCNTSLPSFYTRVSSVLEWIENTVWPWAVPWLVLRSNLSCTNFYFIALTSIKRRKTF